jgi:hypothetical protein
LDVEDAAYEKFFVHHLGMPRNWVTHPAFTAFSIQERARLLRMLRAYVLVPVLSQLRGGLSSDTNIDVLQQQLGDFPDFMGIGDNSQLWIWKMASNSTKLSCSLVISGFHGDLLSGESWRHLLGYKPPTGMICVYV